MKPFVIGLDFGTDSARAVLVDTVDGRVRSSCAMPYPRWARGLYSCAAEDRFRHHPADYLETMEHTVREAARALPPGAEIAGIGVDATCSTPILLDRELRPLPGDDPDAMFILWKDHTAIAEAAEITAAAAPYTVHNGGVYSAENYWSKVLHVLRTNPAVAAQAFTAVELCDYIPFVLTGRLRPSHCAAGSKQLWGAEWGGFPPQAVFDAVDPRLGELRSHVEDRNYDSCTPCGPLSPAWAERLGLPAGIPVGVGNIDAHSGAVGGGCAPGTMILTLGTSACLMTVGAHRDPVPEVFGQVDGAILPGWEGYEMGMSSYGDNFAWIARTTGRDLPSLTQEAAGLALSDRIPVCTDWFNGRRTPAPDPSATATLQGLRLTTTPAELFYAVVEGSAFGIKAIVDHLASYGVTCPRMVATGGIPRKSPFVMQLLSDVLGTDIEVSSEAESCALGAAVNAAVAAGVYPDIAAAQQAMCHVSSEIYRPSGTDHSARYARYRSL